MEFFIDYDRETLEPINGGQAIKKVPSAHTKLSPPASLCAPLSPC